MSFDVETLKNGLQGRCPKCCKGQIFQTGFNLDMKENCDHCGLDLSKNDSADGPAVFLIFVLGTALVPIALIAEFIFHWPLWMHGVVWGGLALGITWGTLKPLKGYVIALQYKHRPGDWD